MRKLWHRAPLPYRLAMLLAVGLAVLLSLFSAGLFLATRAYVLWQAEQNMRAQAGAAIAADVSAGGGRRGLQALADRLVDARTSAVVYGPSGDLLARGRWQDTRTDAQRNGPQPPRTAASRIARVAEGDRGPRSIERAPNGTRNLVVLIPLGDAAGAVLQLATPMRPIDEFLLGFRRYLLGGTLATALVGAMLGLWATRQALRPLSALVAASDRVAGGDWSTRLALAPDTEWGRVGSAFDLMVARIAESFAAQQRFLADAAHELRTPLTAIGGSIELLRMGAVAGQPDKQRRVLESAGNEIDRLGRLVNNLLLLQTLNARGTVAHTALDLRPLVLDVIAQIEPAAPDHVFHTMLPAPLPMEGDSDQLRQVLLNLLTNAHTYTPAGGSITVTGQLDGGVCVAISDTGIGIAPEDVPHVGERLYRVDRARARGTGGFGLGLAIVYSIVAAHGGSVDIRSTPGQGTTVSLRFPKSEPSSAAHH